jgi:hypothetical protein
MNIYIDISVFLKQKRSMGQVFGNIELPSIPSIGARVSFRSPRSGVTPVVCDGFAGTLEVKAVQLIANAVDDNVIVSLEDLVLNTEADAKAVMEYFKTGFALFVDET